MTKNETFGLAYEKAMYYSKLAVIFTIASFGVNLVSLGRVTDIECPNGDESAYARAITALGENKALCEEFGANARKRVEETFIL